MNRLCKGFTRVIVSLSLFSILILGSLQIPILEGNNLFIETADAAYCYGGGGSTAEECVKNHGQWIDDNIWSGGGNNYSYCYDTFSGHEVVWIDNANYCIQRGYVWMSGSSGGSDDNNNNGELENNNGGNGGYTPPPPPQPPTYSINFNSSVNNNTVATTDESSSEMKQTIIENKEVSLGNMSISDEKSFGIYFQDNASANKQNYKNYYQPEITITDNEVTYSLPVKSNTVGSASKNTLNEIYKNFNRTLRSLELYAFNADKFKTLPSDFNTLLSSKNGLVANTTLQTKDSLYDLNDFKVSDSGHYIFVAKANFTDTTKESKTVAYTLQMQNMDGFSKLPVKNRLSILLDNQKINEGKRSNNHNFPSLKLPSFNSMKILSAYDSDNHVTLVGSVNGGLKLFDENNNEIILTANRINSNLEVSQILPMGDGNFVVSTYNDGVHIVNSNSNEVFKLNNLTENKINASTFNDRYLVTSSDNGLIIFKKNSNEFILRKQLTSKDIFGENIKIGEVNLVGGKIVVNSLYNQNAFKTAVVTF